MPTKIVNSIKYTLTILFFFIGIIYIFNGNKILKDFTLDEKKFHVPKDLKKNNQLKEEKSHINQGLNKEKKLFTTQKTIKDQKQKVSEIIITVKKNDTFFNIIEPFFTNNRIKNLIIEELNKVYNLRNLNIGKKIYFYKNKEGNTNKIILPINFSTDLIIIISNGSVALSKEKINITKEIIASEFTIFSSLYEDGIKAGIPLKILTDAIRLYSFDIDFQRDIQKKTKFSISYEVLFNDVRKNIAYGDIQYINLVLQNNTLEYFQFKTEDGFIDYFNRKGKNVKKSILKTPIDGARLSSNFGMRKHPILGYSKMHKGVDFAAPQGTPVYAGGNGVIEYVGYNGGYGKYIRIRHNNEYKTAYAHLLSFKKGISKGKRVNQGDIIGYVGSTGNSTGPHLHYEIFFQNKQINPMKMRLPSGKILSGSELERFKDEVKVIYAKYLYTLYE
ncbi:M23 family metallopeptidase [Alphaproteobacteria bacterium]|nr:M23 family metallopeptidase [Alphaproteobacteria bacterium]